MKITGQRNGITRFNRLIPRGHPLPDDVWNRRHRAFLLLLWAHVIGLPTFGLFLGVEPLHAVLEGGAIAIPALVASYTPWPKTVRSVAAVLGLLTASGVLVHFSGGTIEAHFHFFVVVTLSSLYQSWYPFLLAIAYVVGHHAIIGTIDPESVYNHPAAVSAPAKWALIHGAFILGASVAGVIVWRNSELLYARLEMRLDEQVRLNRALDAFGSRVAHDLKNPLHMVRNAVLMLRERLELDDATTERLVEMAANQTGKAADLVDDLLALARASGTPRPEMIDMRALTSELSAANDIDVRHDGGSTVVADPVALRQALTNLVENAAKFAPAASAVDIAVSEAPDQDGWVIDVCDRGPGLSVEDAERLFQPFERGSQEVPGTGSGLGLTIVNAAAEAHGGRAWYEPRPGGGSRFRLLIRDTSGAARPPIRLDEETMNPPATA